MVYAYQSGVWYCTIRINTWVLLGRIVSHSFDWDVLLCQVQYILILAYLFKLVLLNSPPFGVSTLQFFVS